MRKYLRFLLGWLLVSSCNLCWLSFAMCCLSSVQNLLQINGEQLLTVLGGKEEYTAVLFYASWCPFSQRMRPVFDDLSSMFPQIKHVAVEESNVMPA
jgi:thiol-disulfide isomerase/thioredoxin